MHFSGSALGGIPLGGIPLEFIFFAAMLVLIAFVPRFAAATAIGGALLVSGYKLLFSPFEEGAGWAGLAGHVAHEWVGLGNLLAMLLGFALLAKHFENSRTPGALRRCLPQGWTSGVLLLFAIFILASFLDNIAAAMIGGTMARAVFRGKVHVGYLAAIVAASNAGGSGSVIGDTTTTMIWLSGVPPREVFSAYTAAVVALLIVAIPASLSQHAYSPARKVEEEKTGVDWASVAVVAFVLLLAIATNLLINLRFADWSGVFPFLGLSVWVALLAMTPLRRPDWLALPGVLKNSLFLLALVWCASMMPVKSLPPASWSGTFIFGAVSAVFDNIPLTALALKQGGFDWGFLAYAVGFGGSLLWFGSSAGVALVDMFPEAKSTRKWIVQGWFVVPAYVIGFFFMLIVLGWHPGQH